MTYFITWEPSMRRLRFIKAPSGYNVPAIRRSLSLPTAATQVWKVSEQKYFYAKEILKNV